jgi:BirA family transcriptional regulator, biotin operon repressor / biotin---[acetyl-CoA-carboxylase] ligase
VEPLLTVTYWLHHLETYPSTNTWALENLETLKDGDVVFTEQQTAGRGQHGRTWQSPQGVLTASFILESVLLSGFSLAAGLAVIFAVEDLISDLVGKLQLKWPNDLYVAERKLGGILCEAKGQKLVIGIGLNCRAELPVAEAISLHQLTDFVPKNLEMLEKLRQTLREAASLIRVQGLTPLLPELRRRDMLAGQQISITCNQETFFAQAAGIDAQGRLLIALPNGQVRPFATGHVQWRDL